MSFATTATVGDWRDVSTTDGYNTVKTLINNLSAGGGTNLERALTSANNQFSKDAVKDVKTRNVVALTDGEPTYYGDPQWQGLLIGNRPNGGGSYCNQKTYDETINAAANLKKTAPLYTVCFGSADNYMTKDDRGNKWDVTV